VSACDGTKSRTESDSPDIKTTGELREEQVMESNRRTEQHHNTAQTASASATQTGRMRAAIAQAVAVAPAFLRGDIDADRMANTMVRAVHSYSEQEQAAGSDGTPRTAEAQQLQQVLIELMGCGSGYLANRCDAACVARTMTQMVQEFGSR
jgi:hypothetical protein